MSVTPDFVGQRYKDTNTGNIWIANSTTPGDWTLELQNAKAEWTPKAIEFLAIPTMVSYYDEFGYGLVDFRIGVQSLIGGIILTGPAATLLSVSFPNLISIDPTNTYGANFEFTNAQNLHTISAPNLVLTGFMIQITSNPSLVTLSFDSLVEAGSNLNLISNTALETLSLPSLIGSSFTSGAQKINLDGCSNLKNVSLPSLVLPNGRGFKATDCALTSDSVNHILSRLVANPAYVSGSVDLTGGTNSAPSGQGIVDKATLIGRGVTLLTN